MFTDLKCIDENFISTSNYLFLQV